MEFTSYDNITLEETYEDGQIIFEEGSSGNWVYVILAGSVEISKTVDERKFILSTLGPGEIFGELALIGDVKRTATTRAIGETTVGIIDRAFLGDEFNKLTAAFRPILVTIVERFIMMMERTREFESRKEERVKKALALKYKDRQAFVKAYTENINTGGLFIKTEKPFEVGEEFVLNLEIPAVEKGLQIKCQVAWTRNETEDPREEPIGMGIKFYDMTKRDTEILENYLIETTED